MKTLKTILIATYIIIIILLLLRLIRCENTDKPVIKEKFNADVVMCIDCTGSMGGIINTIKSNALNFYPDLREKCISQGKKIVSMRIKVIGFRDFEDYKTFEVSDFYTIPDQENEFRLFISKLRANGGGDSPERGYDVLGLAMKSNWNKSPNVHQVIILWTDAPSHQLSTRSPGPKTMEELESLWNDNLSQTGKRLFLFVPNHPSWTKLENEWNNTIRHDVNIGGGLSDVDYEEILETLSESI